MKKTTAKNKIQKVVKKVVAEAKKESKELRNEGKKLVRIAEKKWKATAPKRKLIENAAKREASSFLKRTIEIAKELDAEISRKAAARRAKKTPKKATKKAKR
jgi:hypothetical protein